MASSHFNSHLLSSLCQILSNYISVYFLLLYFIGNSVYINYVLSLKTNINNVKLSFFYNKKNQIIRD